MQCQECEEETDELTRVELDPSQRSGILTQPGWLASSTHGVAHSPIVRGLFTANLALQRLTTRPPDDEQIQVALEAFRQVRAIEGEDEQAVS